MSDPLRAYEICVKRLVEELDKQHHLIRDDADIYQLRLLENIRQTKLYGNTPEQQAARMVVIGRLNEITREVFGKGFDEYCETYNSSSSKTSSMKQPGYNQPPIQEPGFIRAVL